MDNKKVGLRASITIEAAILLPFLIIAIMSFVFIIKAYYTSEIIQQAITGACEEMSVYSLLYYETGAEEIIGGIEKFGNSEAAGRATGGNELTSYIQQLSKDATDYVRANTVLIPLAKILVGKKLEVSYYDSVDNRLKGLNLEKGFGSLDFSGSKMLEDGKNIEIIARYEMRFPFLSELLPVIKIEQRALACVWAGEDGINGSEDTQDQGQGIWDMPDLKRGREIRKLQGANLPFNFPTVAKFQNGRVTGIKSLNMDEAYYQNPKNLESKIMSYINKLEDFEGGMSGSVSIGANEISGKELVLVIPETQLTSAQQTTVDKCVQAAGRKGIILKVIKAYGRQGGQGEQSDGPDGNAADKVDSGTNTVSLDKEKTETQD